MWPFKKKLDTGQAFADCDDKILSYKIGTDPAIPGNSQTGVIDMSGQKSLGNIDIDFLAESRKFETRLHNLITGMGKELTARTHHTLTAEVYDFKRLMNGAEVSLGVNTKGIRADKSSNPVAVMVAALGYMCLQWREYKAKKIPGTEMERGIKLLEGILPTTGFKLKVVGDMSKGFTFEVIEKWEQEKVAPEDQNL